MMHFTYEIFALKLLLSLYMNNLFLVSFRVFMIIKSELILVLVDDLAESANARHPIVVVVL